MNTIKNFCCTIIIILLTTGCMKVIMIIYGVKKPKIESTYSLNKFLNEIGVNSEHLYVCKDSLSQSSIIELGNGAPEAEFFDKNGFLIRYKDSSNINCNADVDDFFDSLVNHKVASNNSAFIGDRLNCIIDSKQHNSISFDALPRADYFVILYFAKWTGKRVNKEHIATWINKLDEINKKDVRIELTLIITNL